MDRLDKQKLLNMYDEFQATHTSLLNGLKSNKDLEPKEQRIVERKIGTINTIMTNILKLKNLSD
jgi:hypothetical protein